MSDLCRLSGTEAADFVVKEQPQTSDLWRLSATEVARLVRTRKVSAREVADSALQRMESVNSRINAIVDCRPDQVREQADRVDSVLAQGNDPGPLAGVTVTVKINIDQAGFATTDGSNVLKRWDWKSFRELPTENITVDIHCVTRWSKLGTSWEGVSLDVLLADVKTDLPYAMFRSYGDYTTNLPLKDVMNKQAWIAFKYGGVDLEPGHGGPARLLVPHLYLWKSAKWVKGMTLMAHDKPGFWENLGYHIYGDPWKEQRYSDE